MSICIKAETSRNQVHPYKLIDEMQGFSFIQLSQRFVGVKEVLSPTHILSSPSVKSAAKTQMPLFYVYQCA